MIMRAPEPDDLDFIYACENHSDRLLHGRTGLMLSKHQLKEYIEKYQDRALASGQIRFIIDNDNHAVGILDLFEMDHSSMKASVAIFIHETERRKGLAAEAILFAKEFARDEMGLHQIIATVSSSNIPSVNLFEKTGFQRIAVLPEWTRNCDGRLVDAYLYRAKLNSN